jgi:hypothetical protein
MEVIRASLPCYLLWGALHAREYEKRMQGTKMEATPLPAIKTAGVLAPPLARCHKIILSGESYNIERILSSPESNSRKDVSFGGSFW